MAPAFSFQFAYTLIKCTYTVVFESYLFHVANTSDLAGWLRSLLQETTKAGHIQALIGTLLVYTRREMLGEMGGGWITSKPKTIREVQDRFLIGLDQPQSFLFFFFFLLVFEFPLPSLRSHTLTSNGIDKYNAIDASTLRGVATHRRTWNHI